MLLRDLQTAFAIAWLVISAVVLGVLLAPFLFSSYAIAGWVPLCESKVRGEPPCPLCGMTTAFLLISEGRFEDARNANRASLGLYSTFVLNELFAFLYLRSITKGGRLCRC